MYRIVSLLILASVLLIGSAALAQDTARRATQTQRATSTDTNTSGSGVQGRLSNNTDGQNHYTGSGSCDCTGGSNVPYSGCDNAGQAIWVDGTYDPTGSQQGKACADAACAAAGQGSCNLASLVMGTSGGTDLTGREIQSVQERVVR